MTKLKNFNQFILENKKTDEFRPYYFNLPYYIPEDRFEAGLLKGMKTRREKITRQLTSNNDSVYSSSIEFFNNNSLQDIEVNIIEEIERVVKFISNNPLTGKKVKAKFSKDISLEKYLKSVYTTGEDVLFGTIETTLPLSTFSIRVDYDLYKNIPVFTFWLDGDLFQYYGIFTLEPNDVLGSGEFHTYITADEIIDYLFYETVWRDTIRELSNPNTDLTEIGISKESSEELMNIVNDNPNYSKPIVKNYFNKKFIKVLSNSITNGELTLSNKKSKTIVFPERGQLISIPYLDVAVVPLSTIFQRGTTTTILIEDKHLFNFKDRLKEVFNAYKVDKDAKYVIKVEHTITRDKIISISVGIYSQSLGGWEAVDWKLLDSQEAKQLYFINKKGYPIYFTDFMNL